MGQQILASLIVAIALVFGALGAGCKDKRSGGEARCRRVKQGQRYDAVKKIFGRAEDVRRGSHLAHGHTWKFKGGRCVVRFSGVAVSQDGTWIPRGAGVGAGTGADKAGRPGPAPLDCEAYHRRQKKCLDALVKHGAGEVIGGLKKRMGPLPAAQRARKLAALEQTRTQLERIMGQQLSGPSALSTCQRSYGKPRLGPAARREVRSIRRCLKVTDCAAYAKCFWKHVSSRRVGGAPGK